jgi:hypothetical protein
MNIGIKRAQKIADLMSLQTRLPPVRAIVIGNIHPLPWREAGLLHVGGPVPASRR